MEFDLDYEPQYWDGERHQLSEHGIKVVKIILKNDLDEFTEKEIAALLNIKRMTKALDRMWKAGVLKKYVATKKGSRPSRRWAPDYAGILHNLSEDPEIRDLLQARARRQFTIISEGRTLDGRVTGHRRTARGAFAPRRTR